MCPGPRKRLPAPESATSGDVEEEPAPEGAQVGADPLPSDLAAAGGDGPETSPGAEPQAASPAGETESAPAGEPGGDSLSGSMEETSSGMSSPASNPDSSAASVEPSQQPAPPEIEALPADPSVWTEADKAAFVAWFEALPDDAEAQYIISNPAVVEAFKAARGDPTLG